MRSPAAAQAPAALELDIYGNRILDDDAIANLSGLSLDPKLSELEVKRRLETTSLFSDIRVDRDGETVSIFVREKGSWFVFPYLFQDGEATVFGLAGGKSGLGGHSGNLVGRVQFSKFDQEASLVLRDDYFLDTRWVLGTSFDYANTSHRVYREREVVQRLRHGFTAGSIQTGYHFRPALVGGFDTFLEGHHFDEPSGNRVSGFQASHRLSLTLGTLFEKEGLSRGKTTKLSLEFGNPATDFKFFKASAASKLSMFLNGDFNWVIEPRLETGASLPFYQLFELGGTNMRGFPAQQFRDSTYFVLQNDFLITSLDVWVLKVRPLLFADWAMIQGTGRLGLGAGCRIFIKDVVVPAVQVSAGYGFNPNGWSILASIGPQF